jgi:hypothetical protein
MVNQLTADICVIGGGSGGLSVAAGASQMGSKTILVEGGKMGGDCLNYGCVPSKALIAAAKKAAALKGSEKFGVSGQAPDVDFPAVMDHVAGVIASIEPHDSVERFEGLGVTVLQGYGRFVAPDELEVGETRVKARRLPAQVQRPRPFQGSKTLDTLQMRRFSRIASSRIISSSLAVDRLGLKWPRPMFVWEQRSLCLKHSRHLDEMIPT